MLTVYCTINLWICLQNIYPTSHLGQQGLISILDVYSYEVRVFRKFNVVNYVEINAMRRFLWCVRMQIC